MKPRQVLCSIFAAFSLGTAAHAQEATPTPPPTAPAVETVATAPANPLDFKVSDYLLKNADGQHVDSRGPRYLCADNTQSCWTQEQREAWAVREFRLMMESAVHSCHRRPGNEDMPANYNAFITRNVDTLQASFNTVAEYYVSRSETPRDAMIAQENLESTTGNVYSGAATTEGYCEGAARVLRHVSTLENDADVVAVAHRLMLPPRPAA